MRFPNAPAWALLAGAAFWGVIWYPFRLLALGGLDGAWSTLFAYGFALVAGAAIFPRDVAALRRVPPLALVMGLAIGWSNLAYVIAVLEGEVMRVLLLFYLAPLWTVPLARLLLDERLDRRGALVMSLAFAGAVAMLWHPRLGLPWPASHAEWLGVAAGFFFALGNVLVRRLQSVSDAGKSIVIWVGVVLAAAAYLPFAPLAARAAWDAALSMAALIAMIGAGLVAMGLALQFGLSRMPANRAIVILLFELVVAAIAAYALAGETLGAREWIGGALIVAATVASVVPGGREATA